MYPKILKFAYFSHRRQIIFSYLNDMRKFLTSVVMLFVSIGLFAQYYGEYSMPHTSSLAELQEFVGKHVKVMEPEGYRSIYADEGHGEYVFKQYQNGQMNTVYTITKVKVTKKQILLDLISESGSKAKAKVNIDHHHDYDGMITCESFFLVDKFEADREAIKGKVIYNSKNEAVAEVVDMDVQAVGDGYPQICWVVKSNLNNEEFVVTPEDATTICSRFGEVLSDPRVKHQYEIVGFQFSDYKELHKLEYAYYVVRQIGNAANTHTCSYSDPLSNAFAEDLSGNYVTRLASVEKPSNPEIRYGTTTVVEDDKVTKFSYVDNAIDIIIFGSSTQFSFVLKNVSDNSIKVVWNEAVFVDYDGSTSKIMHLGTKYSQKDGDQPASTVIKGAKIEDVAVPTVNVRYSDLLKDWVTDSMYPSDPGKEPGQLRLMLPIQLKEVINEYIFVFDVKYVFKYPERLNQ